MYRAVWTGPTRTTYVYVGPKNSCCHLRSYFHGFLEVESLGGLLKVFPGGQHGHFEGRGQILKWSKVVLEPGSAFHSFLRILDSSWGFYLWTSFRRTWFLLFSFHVSTTDFSNQASRASGVEDGPASQQLPGSGGFTQSLAELPFCPFRSSCLSWNQMKWKAFPDAGNLNQSFDANARTTTHFGSEEEVWGTILA